MATARLIISADAVAAVRRRSRRASPAASRPVAPSRASGRRQRPQEQPAQRRGEEDHGQDEQHRPAQADGPDLLVDLVGQPGVAVHGDAGCGHDHAGDRGPPPDVPRRRRDLRCAGPPPAGSPPPAEPRTRPTAPSPRPRRPAWRSSAGHAHHDGSPSRSGRPATAPPARAQPVAGGDPGHLPPSSPTRAASPSTSRRTCRRDSPTARSSASSRVRCPTSIENVLAMTKLPTTRAMAANPSRAFRSVSCVRRRLLGRGGEEQRTGDEPVPRVTAASVMASRALCAARLRSARRRISGLPPVEVLHPVEHRSAVGRRSSSTIRPSARKSTRSA